MIVFGRQLTKAAEDMRERGMKIGKLPPELVPVTPDQLTAAGKILGEGPQPIANGIKSDMPGFIDAELQEASDVLLLQVGILPSKTYRIARDGAYTGGDCYCGDDHASWCPMGWPGAQVDALEGTEAS